MRPLLTTVAALALLTAACGDDDAVEATAETTEATAVGATEGGAAVAIRDFAFAPETIEVAVGDTVTWTNGDGVSHTVTAGTSGAASDVFDESLDAGATAAITFDDAGTFDYFCAIHPTMTGQVVVS